MSVSKDRPADIACRGNDEREDDDEREGRGEAAAVEPFHEGDASAVDRAKTAEKPRGVIERDRRIGTAVGPWLVVDAQDPGFECLDLVEEVPESEHGTHHEGASGHIPRIARRSDV